MYIQVLLPMKSILHVLLLMSILGFQPAGAQKKVMETKKEIKNPLLCDPDSGICEMPAGADFQSEPIEVKSSEKPVQVIYYTDPICSSCWGIEPALRKLKLEYGDYIHVEYRMGGLLPSWEIYNSGGISKPGDVAHHWDEVSDYYRMPIDGDVWLEDPLPSSYPPSIAFKAAQIQDEGKAIHFLRIIREMVFLEKKNITKKEHLVTAAQQAGLDTSRFVQDFNGAAQESFKEDLMLGRALGVRGFPTLFFKDSAGNQSMVYGFRPYEQFEAAVLKAFPEAKKKAYSTEIAVLFSYYPTLTLQEAIVLSGNTEAEKKLNELLREGKLTRFDSKKGSVWRKK